MQQMQRLLGALQAEQAALEAQQPADDATQQRLDKVRRDIATLSQIAPPAEKEDVAHANADEHPKDPPRAKSKLLTDFDQFFEETGKAVRGARGDPAPPAPAPAPAAAPPIRWREPVSSAPPAETTDGDTVNALFSAMDADGDDRITEAEFRAALLGQLQQPPHANVEAPAPSGVGEQALVGSWIVMHYDDQDGGDRTAQVVGWDPTMASHELAWLEDGATNSWIQDIQPGEYTVLRTAPTTGSSAAPVLEPADPAEAPTAQPRSSLAEKRAAADSWFSERARLAGEGGRAPAPAPAPSRQVKGPAVVSSRGAAEEHGSGRVGGGGGGGGGARSPRSPRQARAVERAVRSSTAASTARPGWRAGGSRSPVPPPQQPGSPARAAAVRGSSGFLSVRSSSGGEGGAGGGGAGGERRPTVRAEDKLRADRERRLAMAAKSQQLLANITEGGGGGGGDSAHRWPQRSASIFGGTIRQPAGGPRHLQTSYTPRLVSTRGSAATAGSERTPSGVLGDGGAAAAARTPRFSGPGGLGAFDQPSASSNPFLASSYREDVKARLAERRRLALSR
jgi:ribosomal protein L29